MPFTLSRVERLYREYTVTAALPDGSPATLTAVDIAFLAPGATPTAATAWTRTTYTAGVARVLLAGPDAAAEGALTVPAPGADIWLRVVDTPEVDTAMIERVTIQ